MPQQTALQESARPMQRSQVLVWCPLGAMILLSGRAFLLDIIRCSRPGCSQGAGALAGTDADPLTVFQNFFGTSDPLVAAHGASQPARTRLSCYDGWGVCDTSPDATRVSDLASEPAGVERAIEECIGPAQQQPGQPELVRTHACTAPKAARVTSRMQTCSAVTYSAYQAGCSFCWCHHTAIALAGSLLLLHD